MQERRGQTRANFERQRDRFVGEDEIAYRFGRAAELLRGSQDEVAEGFALAEQTLAYDPYNIAMHRELAVARARAGDAENLEYNLSVCFDMGALDAAALRADPRLRGALTKGAFEELVGRIEKACTHRTRFKDLCFDEIAPNTSSYETTLVWKDEDHEAVAAAFGRLVDAAARQAVAAGREKIEQARSWLDVYEEKLKSPFRLDDGLIGTHCFFGSVHRFFRESAPYLDDVRFLMFDQVSAIDEVWIVDGAFHLCRHPIHDSGHSERARFFEELCERHGLEDPALRKYIAMCWGVVAHVSLEANENRRSHADRTSADAEHAIRRMRALGESPDFFEARLAIFRRDFAAATRHLERTIAEIPSHREAIAMLARRRLHDERWEDVIVFTKQAAELNPNYCDDCQLLRAIALESLGRVDEARSAYRSHMKMHGPARLLEDARALVERGLHASARRIYTQLRRRSSTEGLAAEVGLLRCAIATKQVEKAREHYERVLARGRELRTANAGTPWILAAIARLEAEARAVLG